MYKASADIFPGPYPRPRPQRNRSISTTPNPITEARATRPRPKRNRNISTTPRGPITETRATNTAVPFSERFYRAIGPLVGVGRDGSVSSGRFGSYADDVYSGKRTLLPGPDITGLNRVSRGTTQMWDANTAAERWRGAGNVGVGALQALVLSRLPGVGLARGGASPVVSRFLPALSNSRFLGTAGGTAPTWATAIPGGGTSVGQQIINPIFSSVGKGLDYGTRAAYNPASLLPRLRNIQNPLTRYGVNIGGRLLSPAGIGHSWSAYNATGDIENYYANPMSSGERLALAAGNYLPNALVPWAYTAPVTDLGIHSLRTRSQAKHLDDLIPNAIRTPEEVASKTFTPSDYYQRETPLPFGYINRARNRTMPIRIAPGETPYGTQEEISNLVQHNNRALAETPMFIYGEPLLTEDGEPITDRNIAGLHNQYAAQAAARSNASWWNRFLLFLANLVGNKKERIV